MITYLEGRIINKEEKSAIILINNIGYKFFATSNLINSLKEDGETSIWTHLAIREDSQTLYAFSSKDELNFFELLISSVSGIGPKTALGILNVSSVKDLRRAINTKDTSHLTKVSGIGKKVAEKIVLELKGKFGAEENDNSISLKDEVDALEALKALGFGHKEAREALKEVDESIINTGERVKLALKKLGK